MNILSIGYGRALFAEDDPERARLAACAEAVSSMHHIVFSRRTHRLAPARVRGTFFLYPTDSIAGPLMILDAIRIGLRILKEGKGNGPWCITTQDPFAAGLAGYVLHLLSGHPFVVQEHGDFYAGPYWRRESLRNQAFSVLGRLILRRATRVRVVSLRLKEHIRALGVPASRITVLPVYTDTRALREAQPREDLHATHRSASVIVLAVARLVPQKNLPLLIEAFAGLRIAQPDAMLVLVGAGPEESRLRSLIRDRGLEAAVDMRPWTSDVASLMKTADIYALSSNYEGWGRVLVEAKACGLPIVTTDVGCVGEVVRHGVEALIVPVADRVAFTNALAALASNEETRIRIKALAHEEGEANGLPAYVRAWARVFTDIHV
jgi:glycosyltransferase involved in cell wall biosynthesis